jgi:activator of HSP90 ATPase
VSVSKVNSIEGDALITMTRGKKKFIYDYTISLDWKLEIGECDLKTILHRNAFEHGNCIVAKRFFTVFFNVI